MAIDLRRFFAAWEVHAGIEPRRGVRPAYHMPALGIAYPPASAPAWPAATYRWRVHDQARTLVPSDPNCFSGSY